ncbi:MAG TPA: hypothetical protein VG275_07195 [Solirubrobacteraceae bacterium]|jgi:hypothetical protein|nr:hypothetical protein [Solirubrobacteraceae bacterium]
MTIIEQDRAGDTKPVPGKHCRGCGRVGEWPGLPCPACKAEGGGISATPFTRLRTDGGAQHHDRV